MTEAVFTSHIAELLKRKDQVSISGIGTLSASYLSSRYDEKNDRFLPPSKSVLFDSLILEDTDLIARYISKNSEESLIEISQEIETVVSSWKSKLELGERISIGEIGYLYKDSIGNFSFKQEGYHELLSESYGLKPVGFITKETFIRAEEVLFEPHEETVVINEAPKKELKFEIEQPERIEKENRPSVPLKETEEFTEKETAKKGKFNKKYLLALALIPIAFYAYWIPVKTSFLDTGNVQMAELNPFRGQTDATYKPETFKFQEDVSEELTLEEQIRMLPPEVETFNMSLDGDLYIPVRLDKRESIDLNTDVNNTSEENPIDVKEVVASNPIESKPVSSDLNYHLIGGCFSDKNNADAFVVNMKSSGHPAFILDHHKGLHRVSIGQFDNRENAKDALKAFRSTGESAWVLKK